MLDFGLDELPTRPAEFQVLARLLVGPSDGSGEESFDITVCSPEWLRARCAKEGFVDARHHLVVNADQFTESGLRTYMERRVSQATGSDWSEVAARLSRLGYWEFEDYRE